MSETLIEALRRRAADSPGSVNIHLREEDGRIETIRFAGLLEGATAAAAALRKHGLRPGDPVGIMLPTCREFFFTFLGVQLAGGIPVPIYPPMRAAQIEEYARRQSAILRSAGVRILVTFREAERIAHLLKPQVASLSAVVRADLLLAGPAPNGGIAVDPRPEDIALIQYTSGSTGEPKGVTLTHRNLVANVRAIGWGVGVEPNDVVVSWLPLYHDMGLIGCWLFSLYFGLELAAMSPVAFLRRPERWLRMIHDHRGTLSPAPNFGYELCARKVSDDDLKNLDLSSWRVALNGAEPIHPETLDRFLARFGPFGFRPETMMPVYGLAETSVALAFSKRGTPPRFDAVDKDDFERNGLAKPAHSGSTLRFVSVGQALPKHEVRIVDSKGRVLPERSEGNIQFRGPSAMQGYYRNPEATAEVRDGEWYRTGDLGYLAGGELYITGRTKDLIIQAGRNIHPQEIEKLAAEVSGVRRGCVAAFSVAKRESGTESLVIVAETRETDPEKRRQIANEMKRRVGAAIISPDVVFMAGPNVIPKTPSGKLQRDACRRMYLKGTLDGGRRPAWFQIAKLVGQAAWHSLRKKA